MSGIEVFFWILNSTILYGTQIICVMLVYLGHTNCKHNDYMLLHIFLSFVFN